MSADAGRSRRWVLVAVSALGLLSVAGAIGVPWAIRSNLVANQAKTCELAVAFVRERPGASPNGPEEVGRCLADVLQDLEPAVRQQLEEAMVQHDSSLRRPSEPLDGSLLDIPLSAETFTAVERCAAARTSRWRGGHGLAMRGLLERFGREVNLERDSDRRLRRLLLVLELWADAYAMLDLSITGPLLWAREIGHTGLAANAETRALAAERMRALAASLPDVETATALFYCVVYGEVRELELFDAWEANDQFGASLSVAASADPSPWGRNPSASRLDRAIPSGVLHDQFVEPGSAYVAGTLLVAAHQLDPSEEDTFLDQPVVSVPPDEAPMSIEPCSRLVLPSALDDRELELCALDPGASVATRELIRLFRALRAAAPEGLTIPERIDDLVLPEGAEEPRPAEPPCTPEPRAAEALEAWAAIGYEAPPVRRVALTLLRPEGTPPPSVRGGVDRYDVGWRQLRARWRSTCEGPVHEAHLWVDGPATNPRANPLELRDGSGSEPAPERP